MTSLTDFPHQSGTVQQQPYRSFEPRKPLKILAVVLLIVLLAGTSGYLLGIKTGQRTPQSTQKASLHSSPTGVQSIPSIAISLAAQANPTADWKIYTNDIFHFSFSYPVRYYKYLFLDDQSTHNLSLHFGVANDPEAKNGYMPVDSTTLYVNVRDDAQTINDILGSQPYNYQGTEKEATSIGGEKGYVINNLNVSKALRNESGFEYSGIVQHKHFIYIVGISSPIQAVLEAHKLEFNQILSTFTFTTNKAL